MEAPARYVSLYRKYRPLTFDGVIGQQTVIRILKGSVDSGRVSHAYLFAGPKGTGKTTVARILAKSLNCEHGPTSSPCMTCDHCSAITAGSDVDVLEIDAASNRGVDEIRDVRESTRFVPARSRKKVFIIDEAHMLTPVAFNALLKTLEEPPEYVVFILATTEPQKLPETILSRCQRFDFKRIADQDMLDSLRTLRDIEAPRVTDDALREIVALSEGSMRGAIGLVDQFSVFGEEPVTGDTVLDLLGLPTEENVALLIEAILQRDTSRIAATLERLERGGVEPADLLEQAIALISGYLLDSATSTDERSSDVTKSRFGAFDDALLVELMTSFAQVLRQTAYLSDAYPLVQGFLLAFGLGLPMPWEAMKEQKPAIPFGPASSAGVQSRPVASNRDERGDESSGDAMESTSTEAPPTSDMSSGQLLWQQFQERVGSASGPIGVMLHALDVRDVLVEHGVLRIVLGPRAKLYKAALDGKMDDVLLPAAQAVYGVTGVILAEQETPGTPAAEVLPSAPDTDDKLELLKRTFDATESLFES
ncbi:MAG: DNA polymerase III subunit gamma/tau [Caldisericota bacterium]|jgi:DNA polymerase III subunit gamma/tau|nr:DNA polymerase III subunit gamma/tau [Caldisericota bacterium]